MISEEQARLLAIALRRRIEKSGMSGLLKGKMFEAIDLIPLGWQVANSREDSRVDVALESDDSD